MAELLVLFYVFACGAWFFAVQREGTIGVGVRYLLVANFASQFLVGPLVYWISGALPPAIDESAYEKTLWIVLVGFLAFTVGGYLVAPWWLRRLIYSGRLALPATQALAPQHQWQSGKLVVGIGVFALVLSPLAYTLPTVRALWSQMTLFMYTGSAMLCLNGLATRQGRRVGIGLASALGTGLLTSVATGFFGYTLISLLYCTSLVLLWRKTQFANWLVLASVSVLSLIPYNMWLSGREAIRSGIREGTSFSERVEAFWELTHIPGIADLTPSAQSDRIAERLDQSTLLVAAVSYTPAIEPYALGETMWEPMFIALVPRALWPDKPLSAGGNEFVSRFTGWRFGAETSVGLHPLFEFYVNFGPFGAAVGLLLMGLVAGVLDGMYWLRAPTSLTAQLVILQSMWAMVTSMRVMDLAMTLPATILISIGVSRVIHKYLFHRRPPATRARAEVVTREGL
jgi:hypothetical protein